ncbi:hypothetical protein A2U01_0046080, partial [Trifolium medium]|nr:hypothetical protein [Trifolium medium]
MSRIKEQCQEIELRNRRIDTVERPTQCRDVEAIKTQDSQMQGIQEDTKEFDEREEPIEESEPIIQENPQPTQTPPAQTTPKSPVLVQPYPSKNEKKETQKEIDKKIDGYMNKTEISVPLKDLLRIAPPFNKYMKKLVSGKIQFSEKGTVMLTEECSALFQKKLPQKCKDPGSI